ncbi:MAG: hypothetical protein PUF72_07925 [Clostridiales bacterium]|nr:hypothetical protein [Clostridiales bacterium]
MKTYKNTAIPRPKDPQIVTIDNVYVMIYFVYTGSTTCIFRGTAACR